MLNKLSKGRNLQSKLKTKIQSKIFNQNSKANFLSGTNTRYVEQMYNSWKKDPNSIHISWKTYFENLEMGLGDKSFTSPPTLEPSFSNFNSNQGSVSNESIQDAININQLIRAYQKSGYLKANMDPLALTDFKHFPIFKNVENLNYKTLGFKDSDLEREFQIPYNAAKEGMLKTNQKMKLKDLIALLEKTYCGNIGIEYTHISNREEINFISDYMENKWLKLNISKEEKIDLFKKLVWASKFESFVDVKFTTKRFGVEGLETLITGLDTFFNEMSALGAKDITLGMAHRGRLNILANLFGKPMNTIFKEFMGKMIDNEGFTYWRSGDVKYHLGYSTTKKMKNGKPMKLEILCNPSHLECVNPVVQGKVRAKQHYNGDSTREE